MHEHRGRVLASRGTREVSKLWPQTSHKVLTLPTASVVGALFAMPTLGLLMSLVAVMPPNSVLPGFYIQENDPTFV